MNTTDKLAEALRLAREWFRHEEAGEGPQAYDVIKAADEAIAAHEAEQAQEAGSEQPYEKIVQMKLPGADGKQRLTDCANVAAQAVPAVRVADVGFRWDGEKQQHVPTLLVEFEPVPANSGSDAKGWRDRDAMAAMLAAATAAPAPEAQAAGQELPPLPEPDGTVEIDCGPAPGGGREIVFEDGYSADQMHAYARAALAQHQPLTDERILAMVKAAPALKTAEAEWLHVARAIERAHGIGGATTGEQR